MEQYSFEKVSDPGRGGLFDKLADRCYVLCMPKCRDRVKRQIAQDRPHSNITIQVNNGARPARNSTIADICLAYGNVFRKALSDGFSRAIVLEDDFFIGEDRDRREAADAAGRIASFLDGRIFDTYNLGRVGFVGFPVAAGSWRALWHGTSHAVLYSPRFMETYVRQLETNPSPVISSGFDIWWNRAELVNYTYHRALVFQTFPPTPNRKHWDNALSRAFIDATGLSHSHQPGFGACNAISKAALPAFIAVVVLSAAAAASLASRISSRISTAPDSR